VKSLFKKTAIAAVVSAGLVVATGCDHKLQISNGNVAKSGAITADSTFEDKAAYAIGASLGDYVAQMKNTQEQLVGVIPTDKIIAGFSDGVTSQGAMDRPQIEATLKELDKKIQEKIEQHSKAAAADNLKQGEAFLQANAKKDGVVVTASGLQYKVITEGTGAKPQKGDTISVTYKGTTIDGKVFDEQSKPVEFPLDNMIPGWVEGLQLMSEGSEYELYIPSKLGYGENAVGQVIKPNSTLVFNVKLVQVKKAEAKAEEPKAEEKAAAKK
jgi:FKBP-type peptidyl-prolyl cis-trans isomerase